MRAYVYRPLFEDETSITALIVWDALNEVDAGGIINHYNVTISGPINLVSSIAKYYVFFT